MYRQCRQNQQCWRSVEGNDVNSTLQENKGLGKAKKDANIVSIALTYLVIATINTLVLTFFFFADILVYY